MSGEICAFPLVTGESDLHGASDAGVAPGEREHDGGVEGTENANMSCCKTRRDPIIGPDAGPDSGLW